MSTDQEERDQLALDEIRKSLAAGFSAIRGSEIRAGLSSLTLDEMIARAITEIDTDESDIRPSKLSVVQEVRESVATAIEQAQKLPPEMFNLTNRSETTNTNSDGSIPEQEDE